MTTPNHSRHPKEDTGKHWWAEDTVAGSRWVESQLSCLTEAEEERMSEGVSQKPCLATSIVSGGHQGVASWLLWSTNLAILCKGGSDSWSQCCQVGEFAVVYLCLSWHGHQNIYFSPQVRCIVEHFVAERSQWQRVSVSVTTGVLLGPFILCNIVIYVPREYCGLYKKTQNHWSPITLQHLLSCILSNICAGPTLAQWLHIKLDLLPPIWTDSAVLYDKLASIINRQLISASPASCQYTGAMLLICLFHLGVNLQSRWVQPNFCQWYLDIRLVVKSPLVVCGFHTRKRWFFKYKCN